MRNDIHSIIDKYWQGESTLEEENALREYLLSDACSSEHQSIAELFRFYESEKNIDFVFEPDLSFVKSKPTRVRFLIPKLVAVAASVLLLFAVNQMWFSPKSDTMYKNKYTELGDPEEALRITLDALGYMSHNLEKGTREVSHIKQFEKTAVFNFDK